jgi:hypothetical protein
MASVLVWYVASSAAVRAQVGWLANQPSVRTAFQSEGGSSDALILLLAFAILTPIAACVLVMLIVFAMKIIELLLGRVRLPEWASVPLVLMAFVYGTYTTREAWLPESLHILGLVARAYLVFSSTVPSLSK